MKSINTVINDGFSRLVNNISQCDKKVAFKSVIVGQDMVGLEKLRLVELEIRWDFYP